MGGEADREEESVEKQVGRISSTSTHTEPTRNVVVNDNFATVPADFATTLINRNTCSITFWMEHIFPRLDEKKGWLSEQMLIEQRIEIGRNVLSLFRSVRGSKNFRGLKEVEFLGIGFVGM